MIPRLLHRTVPAVTTREIEGYWRDACNLHPTWDWRTWRDPIARESFPISHPVWDLCGSGAQRAGLIRLEALWHHGGVYIDSDVELLRPLDSLLGARIFAAWEDERVVPDAVIGAVDHDDLVWRMLVEAVARVRRGDGAWATGPGVTTELLTSEHASDVLLLPPGSFYPVHYTRKGEPELWAQARTWPWVFGLHHWHHSWATS